MLVKGDRIIDDPFQPVADTDPLPEGPAIVSLKRFKAEAGALLARRFPLGVRLETADAPEALGENVSKLALIVLHVPHFRDGRAFSQARQLRTRAHYKGELRVSGHVLKDQLAFYARVGVDAFELPRELPLADIEAALHEISNVYQPSADGRTTIQELRSAREQATPRPS